MGVSKPLKQRASVDVFEKSARFQVSLSFGATECIAANQE
jgi:hypothetical protein